MAGVIDLLKRLGPARLGAMGAVAAILVGFFVVIVVQASRPGMAVLYGELALEDSAAIVKELDQQNIPYELRDEGARILVPKDAIARLRMRLAEKSLPTGGSVGYEIFDKTETLGTTTFVQNIKHLRALEGELARTIRAIDRVQAARVHLVIPERQLFQRDRKEPTASIVLKVRGTLEAMQIRAVQHLVASAVEGLKPGRVAIVDESGKLLASGADDTPDGLVATSLEERRLALEKRLRTEIEEIVSSVVGRGRARIQVSAELDLNRVTQTADLFDPNGQVVRSTQTKEERTQTGTTERTVTVGTQVPGGQPEQTPGATKDGSQVAEETINYEISKTTRTEITEAGRLKRLSVAVLVDGIYTQPAGGDLVYQPRPQADLDQIAALVRSAVGFDEKRGDLVQVINLRFAEAPVPVSPPGGLGGGLFEFGRDDLMRFTELGVMAFLTLAVLFFAVRPLLKRITAPETRAEIAPPVTGTAVALPGPGTAAPASEGPGTAAALPAPAGADVPPGLPIPAGVLDPALIEQAKLIGLVHAASIRRMGDLVRENPEGAAQVVREWLGQAA